MDEGLAGKVALVTGAAGRGIGRAVCVRLAEAGARVVVTDSHAKRTAEVAAELAARFPDTVVAGHQLDAGDRSGIDAVVATVERELGPVQVLVNNAAVNVLGGIETYDPADWDRVMAVNVSGPWYLTRAVWRGMREAGGGSVVNVSSYAPDVGGHGLESPYAVSKGGLGVLTRSCAHEGGPHRIRVNTVAMGVVTGTKFVDDHPELLANAEGVLPWLPTSGDIAECVAWLAGDRSRSVTGETVNVASGAYMRI